jgi:hypothetical protein
VGFYSNLNAQIPEGVQFQPGSYMVPYRSVQPQKAANPAIANTIGIAEALDALDEDNGEADDSTTAWEKKFSPQVIAPAPTTMPMPQPYDVPHLTFVYNHWTRRFHIAPYEPGYAANPAAFPIQTSPLHVWVSSAASGAQPNPQVPYMSYYDPDPVVLPAEIRLYGTKIAANLALQPQIQPMPLPSPRPDMAQPVAPPARTRVGERIRNAGTFFLPR